MPIYEKCYSEVKDLALKLMAEWDDISDLYQARVSVEYLFAAPDLDPETGEALNHAITVNGYKCLATVKVMSPPDRVMGSADARITIDQNHWEDASDDEKEALLAHELYHIEVALDKEGSPKKDDAGRPKLKLRKHDIQVGWFRLIAARYGRASVERQQAKEIMTDSGQLFWPELMGDPRADEDAVAAARAIREAGAKISVVG